jgi:anthranilate synthase component 1
MIRDSRFDMPKELPSMAAGLFGFMSYDAARSIEPSVPDSNPDPLQLPTGIYVRPRLVLVFDSVFDEVFVVYTIWPEDQYSPEVDYIKGQNSINTVMTKLKQTNIENAYSSEQKESPLEFSSNFTEATFKSVVETCKDYIRAGDIFQVVPSQRFQAPFPYKAFSFYRALRKTNPSPYLFFLNFGDFQLVGSSPEVMVRLENATMTIRPLAGTRPRGKTPAEDNALSSELLADNKEISEHLMLVDLSRHDVGRVSKPGSVKVTEQMTIEYYSHVMHISSNVDGELDPRFDALDALLSGLPLGTVSGAPKIRAMQLIDELEPVKRSFYAGSVGYFSASGDMNTCVTLRTALIKDNTLTIQSGCGVVADSDPQKEYDETVNKAKALMKAAGLTASFDS